MRNNDLVFTRNVFAAFLLREVKFINQTFLDGKYGSYSEHLYNHPLLILKSV